MVKIQTMRLLGYLIPYLTNHAIPETIHYFTMFSICNQVEIVGELHSLG